MKDYCVTIKFEIKANDPVEASKKIQKFIPILRRFEIDGYFEKVYMGSAEEVIHIKNNSNPPSIEAYYGWKEPYSGRNMGD